MCANEQQQRMCIKCEGVYEGAGAIPLESIILLQMVHQAAKESNQIRSRHIILETPILQHI